MRIINPKIEAIDYGPEVVLSNGKKITADEFVYGAAGITYKDVGAMEEFLELEKKGEMSPEKIKKSLIKTAGAGHASMATTPGFWCFLKGACSKIVDSLFTTPRFSSSLMPSGRRIPIEKNQIVVPKGIAEKRDAANIYMKTSEKNIQLYEELQERGVPKQEASKIVQYGHRGGGFMFMPLETLIYFSKEAESNPDLIPQEGKEIISQLEDFICEHGMGITYEARKNAPRTSCPNPNIFHDRKNMAQEYIEKNKTMKTSPIIISQNLIPSNEREKRINEYLKKRGEIFSSPEKIQASWKNLLKELENIVGDYNNSASVVIGTNSPWRIWGEVKRHRTLSQTVESIYHAIERAQEIIDTSLDPFYSKEHLIDKFSQIVSLPESVKKDKTNFLSWAGAFSDSIESYEQMVRMGIPKSDALLVVPRGIKLAIIKDFDLYNLTTGYSSLRLCETAEPEMRETTEHERYLMKCQGSLPNSIIQLITPKCAYTGFCPETKYCGKIRDYVPEYNKDFHESMQKSREAEILKNIHQKNL